MGKSLKGKELGKGISQRKDGRYYARFTNRFGKRQEIYGKTLNEVRTKLKKEQDDDEKRVNIVTKNIILDEWYDIWLKTCKMNCRNSTKESYATHYKRIQKDLGWRKLTNLNLIIMQDAFNKLSSDNARANSKKILVDMLNKAVATELLTKNYATQIVTVIDKEEKRERRVLTVGEATTFLKYAEGTFYYNLFVLALETGMRIGELLALTWEDIDFRKEMLHVRHTLCYFSKEGKYVFEVHDTKTNNGKRDIPLTPTAIKALKRQRVLKQEILLKGKKAPEGYENLVFFTKNNKPTQQFLIQESMNLIIKKIQREDADFKSFTPHTFRHTFATRAIERGLQPKSVSKLLGHGQLKLTMDLYCHVTEETLYEEMKKMCV